MARDQISRSEHAVPTKKKKFSKEKKEYYSVNRMSNNPLVLFVIIRIFLISGERERERKKSKQKGSGVSSLMLLTKKIRHVHSNTFFFFFFSYSVPPKTDVKISFLVGDGSP
jgi:hypothetical protein